MTYYSNIPKIAQSLTSAEDMEENTLIGTVERNNVYSIYNSLQTLVES